VVKHWVATAGQTDSAMGNSRTLCPATLRRSRPRTLSSLRFCLLPKFHRLCKTAQTGLCQIATFACLNMTEDENHIWPTCRNGTGTPTVVTAVRRMIQVDLACKECGHAWSIEYPDPTVFESR
jgi:hypothetical protein